MAAKSETSGDQVRRLLQLVPYLHAHQGVRLQEAAAALGVPTEQVLADLKVLLMCGLPGGYPDDLIDVDLDALEDEEGSGVIVVTNADYLARPLRLTPTEASALIVALRTLRAGADPSTREVVDRTLAKLESAAATGDVATQVEVAEDDDPLVGLRADLEQAVAAKRQVRLTYYVPTRDEESERVVDPHAVVTRDGAAYLDAWCHSAEAPRLFRLDRIHAAEVLDTRVVSEPDAPREHGGAFFEPGPDAPVATLRLARPARWVTEYYPVVDVRELADGELEVDLAVGDPRWLRRLLLRLAPHARVVAPAEYAAEFAAAARATLGMYDR